MPNLAATAPHPGRRLFFGLAVSILLHASLLMLLRAPAPSAVPDARRWSSLEVRVQLLPPPPVPIPQAVPPPLVQPRRVEPRKLEPPAEVQRPAVKEPLRRKPPEAIYHQPNDRRPFGPGDGFWDGVAAWDPLSGEYVVLSLDNFDGIWVAWTFDNAQVTSTPVCATVLRQNFGRVGPGLHSFQPTLASGCEPGVAYRLTP